jgi:predicted branched-subunit amino acid permease
MLAVRNAAYGLSLAPILPGRLRERALLAQLVIDETTAAARAQDETAAARYAFLALLAPQLRRPGAPVAAVVGVVLAAALVPFTPAGVPVIAALAGVVPGVLAANGVRR